MKAWRDAPEWATSAAEAGEWLDMGEKAVRGGVRAGTIPALHSGRLIQIPVREILKRLSDQIDVMVGANTDNGDPGKIAVVITSPGGGESGDSG